MIRKFVICSDLHGHLIDPKDIPECDFLLIGGDICPNFNNGGGSVREQAAQLNWLLTKFKAWLDKIPAKHVIATWGNHDWVGQYFNPIHLQDLRWHMLVDYQIELDGVTFHGSPWQREFGKWAFNCKEESLEEMWTYIIEDTDVLIFHGPPYGVGDKTPRGENVGSPSQLEAIKEFKPKLACWGHIHQGYGAYKIGQTICYNASIMNEAYEPVNKPHYIEMDI